MKKPYLILLLIAFFAITKQTKALITYTVVNKTAVLNQSVIIDVNKDGVDDFELRIDSLPGFYYSKIKVLNQNYVIDFSTHGYLDPIDPMYSINATCLWSNFSDINSAGIIGTISNDMFGGNGNKYIGLKIKKDNANYYAWVQVNLNVNRSQLIIAEMACNTIAEEAILAGQKFTSGLNEFNFATNFEIRQHEKIVQIELKDDMNMLNQLQLIDLTGKVLCTIEKYESNIEINLNALANGIYLLLIQKDQQSISRKIVLHD